MVSGESGKPNSNVGKHERRYYVDWLRIFSVVTIFFFHCARFFDYDDWHVKNSQLSFSMTLFVAFVVQWVMPLMFVLSGQSANWSLMSRKSRQYLRERFQRLIIPFVIGIFVLAPPQIYFERVSKEQFTGSFIQFFPRYFDGFYGFGGNFAWMGLHLWYLLFLFVFSVFTLPLFCYLRKGTRTSGSKVAAFLDKRGGIFLLALPIALSLAFTDWLFLPGGFLADFSGFFYFGGWNLFVYVIFFVYGYLLASDRFMQTVRRNGKTALVMGVISSVLVFLPLTSWNPFVFDYPFAYILNSVFGAFYSWFWVIAILSLGGMHLSFNHRWLRGANEAVLPFYVLHQPVILAIGFYVVNLNLSVIVKYFLIGDVSMGIVILLILVIRRVNLLRLIFGMRLKNEN